MLNSFQWKWVLQFQHHCLVLVLKSCQLAEGLIFMRAISRDSDEKHLKDLNSRCILYWCTFIHVRVKFIYQKLQIFMFYITWIMVFVNSRRSHWKCSVKMVLLKILILKKFHRKTPVLESLFNKVGRPQVCNFMKKRFQHSCFLVKFAKFLRTHILKNICDSLLLKLFSLSLHVHC